MVPTKIKIKILAKRTICGTLGSKGVSVKDMNVTETKGTDAIEEYEGSDLIEIVKWSRIVIK